MCESESRSRSGEEEAREDSLIFMKKEGREGEAGKRYC